MPIIDRQQRQANTKNEILTAARALIAEKGLDKLSLREIARRVEYSPAGLYEYFDSKEDILRSLAQKGDSQLRSILEGISVDFPPVERLIQTCLAYIEFASHNPEYFAVINSLPTRRASLDELVPQESSYFIFLLAVQDTIDAGELTPREDFGLEEISYGFWALIHGMAMLRSSHLRDYEANFETANRRALEAFIRGQK